MRREHTNVLTHVSAARASASLFGVLAGLGGIMHGIGEILQGNVAPNGILIMSWTEGPIATNMGGEPAMTVIPNLLVTGILTNIVALAVIVWAAVFVAREQGGLILILLCIAMLLVGGGFAPPILGLLAGVAGTAIRSPLTWWRTHPRAGVRRVLAKAWPWIYGVTAANAIFLVVGSVILVFLFGLNKPDLFVNSFLFAIASLIVTILTGIAFDVQRREHDSGSIHTPSATQ